MPSIHQPLILLHLIYLNLSLIFVFLHSFPEICLSVFCCRGLLIPEMTLVLCNCIFSPVTNKLLTTPLQNYAQKPKILPLFLQDPLEHLDYCQEISWRQTLKPPGAIHETN